MTNRPSRSAPPVIRVFLSSTFADMEQERSYFNEVLTPKISRICAERGVSFFSVDLRWGITQEDQVNGQVLPICLGEIDKCRPYFIGIVGNRYGSVLESVPAQIAQSIPWLTGKEGHSITELEMLYAVLDKDKADGCADSAFYLRSDRLSRELYGNVSNESEASRRRLEELKQRITTDEVVPSASYDSMEEFGELVMRDLLRWLDAHFPASADVNRIRREWYDGELLRDYIEPTRMVHFLNTYLAESKKPLLFFGDGARGKTAFLTAWQPAEGKKIVVNLAADDRFSYWPSVARHLAHSIRELYPDCGLPEGMTEQDAFFVSDEARERFGAAFLQWFGGLRLPQPLTIVINDLNLLEDEQGRLLSWLPAVPPKGVRLLGSTNDDEMVQNASLLGWNVKEMSLFDRESASVLVTNYLHTFGKKVTDEQLDRLLQSACACYPGQLRFVAAFLVNFGRFNILDELIDKIGGLSKIDEMYHYAYNYLMSEYSTKERSAVRLVLGLVRAAAFSLNESLCYEICRRTHDLTAIEWARCCRIFEQFEIIQGDYWNLRNEEMQKFVDTLLSTTELQEAHAVLGDHFLQELCAVTADANHQDVRLRTAYAKAVLTHYRRAEAWDKLTDALSEHAVLCHLYKLDWLYVRAAWVALFLHTDCDIPDRLIGLVQHYVDKGDEESRAIALRVGGLFVDMDCDARFNEVCRVLGVKQLTSSLHGGLEWMMSKAFAPTFKQMTQMQQSGWHRELLTYVDGLLAQSLPLNAVESCQLWYLKADCESRLHLYEAGIKTVNEYYEMAIRAGLSFEMLRALTMRGEILYHLERDREAMELQERLMQMALHNGDLRSYMAARNMLAMCMARTRRFVEASVIYDILLEQWQRLDNRVGFANTYMNKCNAMFLSGNADGALQAAKELYDKSCESAALEDVCLQLLGNMGRYAAKLKDYDTAERYLTDTVERAKKKGHESALLNAYTSLVEMYKAGDLWMKAAEVWEEMLEFFWGRGEYDRLLSNLNELMECLFHYGYAKRAKILEENWRQRFATVEGGSEFFEQRRRGTDAVDTVQVDGLREQVIMAKGEGDPRKQADALHELAKALKDSALEEAVPRLLEAAALYRECGSERMHRSCIETALTWLINKGDIRHVALCEQALTVMDDPVVNEIVRCWTQWSALKEQEDPSVYPQLCSLLDNGPRYELLMSCLVMDMASLLMHALTAEELIALTERFSSRLREDVCDVFDHLMFSDEGRGNADLRVDFLSPAATEKLRFYEKAVAYLHHFDRMNAAALAGNIALIFRRRKDKEKTLYYHSLSIDRFRHANKQEDALIEMMNMSTAYREFDDIEGAIKLLREALAHAGACGEKKMEALIAGNLASCLTQLQRPEDREEILRCFALEEGYFRATHHDRDLVISLVNQMIFLHDKVDVSQWRGKLEEALALVNKHHFDEFRSVLSQLEWHASRHSGATEDKGDADFRQRAQALLDAVGGYAIKTVDCTNGTYRAICESTEQGGLPGLSLLYLFHRYDTPGVVGVVTIYQPPMRIQNMEKVDAYMAWWNGLNEYQLQYESEQMLFRADSRLMAPDWEKLAVRLRRFLKLWEADKVNLLSMILGFVEVDLAQGAKLRAMDEAPTATE